MSIISNNEMTGWGVEPDPKKLTGDSVQEEGKRIQPKQDHRKFSLPEGTPQLLVTNDKVTMTYEDGGLCVNENGTIIRGKMHLASDIKDIRLNGFWSFNTELLTCLPSTIYTPMPVLKFSTPPFAEIVSNLARLA